MTDWVALAAVAWEVDGICVRSPGDVPVITRPGCPFQVVAEHEGYDVWFVGSADKTIAGDGLKLIATSVSLEVAAKYLKALP